MSDTIDLGSLLPKKDETEEVDLGLHRLKVKLNGAGRGDVLLDGKPILTTSVRVWSTVNELPRVELEVPVEMLELDISGQAFAQLVGTKPCISCNEPTYPHHRYCGHCGMMVLGEGAGE